MSWHRRHSGDLSSDTEWEVSKLHWDCGAAAELIFISAFTCTDILHCLSTGPHSRKETGQVDRSGLVSLHSMRVFRSVQCIVVEGWRISNQC